MLFEKEAYEGVIDDFVDRMVCFHYQCKFEYQYEVARPWICTAVIMTAPSGAKEVVTSADLSRLARASRQD